MIKKISTQVCWVSAMLMALPAQALPTSEVIFAKGSDCGQYQGDLTTGRMFSVEMTANQTLVVKTDGHVQSVTDSKGRLLNDEGGANYRYVAKSSGTHTIKLVGRVESQVEFCVLQ
ncbi:hypothetical protein DLE54_08310 [Psychrobacter sp. YP14]|uniref:Lysozyme inhibitor n=3 Tax=Psychrobacter TaxID=497 RepID=A0A844M012_9GAMM|nr:MULTISPECIES: hypothetical protein [Psychrobacter]AWT49509.1 hypothetical protein DLE54_08310 [Psychrobacter sp. YP14]MUG32309.1 hypothetical protein [Psychrobacter sanguinis]UNK04868.1 hypothetical protein MN210_12050 [Psychrobacter sp. PraFG1]